ncbi:hypothetical protein Kpho02_25510 [Kitasatospora phosalacinea]|uniref:Uncharacterized protein n=1 Tax=Kitasatospora phosalacinea TaxID=2065 RepID=A0A9W6Q5I3_9ACTN|nr:hypothetical protein Kpho02_25510 [Kitasatospora phosalacinea]
MTAPAPPSGGTRVTRPAAPRRRPGTARSPRPATAGRGLRGKSGVQLAAAAELEELLLELPVEDDEVEDVVEVEDVEEDEPLTELLELERLSVR